MKNYICIVEKATEQSLASHYPKHKPLKYMAALGLAEIFSRDSSHLLCVLATAEQCLHSTKAVPTTFPVTIRLAAVKILEET